MVQAIDGYLIGISAAIQTYTLAINWKRKLFSRRWKTYSGVFNLP